MSKMKLQAIGAAGRWVPKRARMLGNPSDVVERQIEHVVQHERDPPGGSRRFGYGWPSLSDLAPLVLMRCSIASRGVVGPPTRLPAMWRPRDPFGRALHTHHWSGSPFIPGAMANAARLAGAPRLGGKTVGSISLEVGNESEETFAGPQENCRRGPGCAASASSGTDPAGHRHGVHTNLRHTFVY